MSVPPSDWYAANTMRGRNRLPPMVSVSSVFPQGHVLGPEGRGTVLG